MNELLHEKLENQHLIEKLKNDIKKMQVVYAEELKEMTVKVRNTLLYRCRSLNKSSGLVKFK